jgi:diacylglycerol kinase (ATP)
MPRKFYQSVKYATLGIKHAFWTQRNIRIHIMIALAVFFLGVWLRVSNFELVALLLSIAFVLISEMINTAVEEMVNLIVKEHRREALIAKDVAAGAVLFSALCAIIVGCLIFIPHIVRR